MRCRRLLLLGGIAGVFDVADTDYLIVPDFLKARPSEEGGKRFVYLEASNEARDYVGEVVLAKALSDSADYYLKFGNIDLDHVTQLGPIKGIKDYPAYEIGRPETVQVDRNRVFVKGLVFQGDAKVADNANMFWDSLTRLVPPQRWFPSVGGAVMDKGPELDPVTRETRTVIRRVRWTNIGFSKTPVNLSVPSVSTVPFGALAKCWGPGGLDLMKALEAGYGTDSASLTGGAALRAESADHRIQSYWDFRDRIAGEIRRKAVHPTAERLLGHATSHLGVDHATAAEWIEKFLVGLSADRQQRKVSAS